MHELQLIPQSIADGWQAKCKCGWSMFSCFQDFDTDKKFGSKEDVLAHLRSEYEAHLP